MGFVLLFVLWFFVVKGHSAVVGVADPEEVTTIRLLRGGRRSTLEVKFIGACGMVSVEVWWGSHPVLRFVEEWSPRRYYRFLPWYRQVPHWWRYGLSQMFLLPVWETLERYCFPDRYACPTCEEGDVCCNCGGDVTVADGLVTCVGCGVIGETRQ